MLTLKVLPLKKEEIRMDQIPVQRTWALIPLYKITDTILFWQIEFNGTNLEIHYDSDEINHVDIIQCENALVTARKQYQIKYHEGYRPGDSATATVMKGMKGYEYKEGAIKSWPVYTQPKLNGIRMLCQDTATGGLSMRSWLNNPYTHLTHLELELRNFFAYLPGYAVLDGELYNHSMDFGTLVSAVKTTKTVHPRLHEIQYWIFDIQYQDHEGAPFEARCTLLINAWNRYTEDHHIPSGFRIVPTQIAYNHEQILQKHNQHVSVGYEGIMIKKIAHNALPNSKQYDEALYRSGKNNHILKYKYFHDEEVVILSIADNSAMVRDCRGQVFTVTMRQVYENNIVGKQLTIRYLRRDDSGVPESAIGVAIRDYE
jgi:hypothetical protein